VRERCCDEGVNDHKSRKRNLREARNKLMERRNDERERVSEETSSCNVETLTMERFSLAGPVLFFFVGPVLFH